MSPLAVNIQRMTVIDFGTTVYYDHSSFIMKIPDPWASKWQLLVEPFQWPVFLAMIVVVAVVILVLSALEMLAEKFKLLRKKRISKKHIASCAWYLLGAALVQGEFFISFLQTDISVNLVEKNRTSGLTSPIRLEELN